MRGATGEIDRIRATPNDVATHVARSMGQHMELGCRLTFDGRLNPPTLSRAVRLALDAEPVLGCSFVPGTFRSEWRRRNDLDTDLPFSEATSEDPDADAIAHMTAAIDDAGPQLRVLLSHTPTGDELVFGVSHDAADGQATKQCAYLLADLYTRLLHDPDLKAPVHSGQRPEAADVWAALTPEQRRRARSTPKMTMPNWKVPRLGASGEGRTLRELRIPPDRFRAIKACGARRGATINAVTLTAFFRAVSSIFPPPAGKAMSLPFTADHRRYLPEGTDIPVSNLAISLWLGVERVAGEPFEGTLERVQAQLDAWKDALWGVSSLMQATSLARLGYGPMRALMGLISGRTGSGASDSATTSPVFTNIGVLDEGRLQFGDLTPVSARLSGPAAFGMSLVPTISTYRDTLTVSMGFCAADVDPAVIEDVLARMDAELATFCAS